MIWRRFQLVVTAAVGLAAFRAGFITLRDQGASAWALALMLCVIAGASWTLTRTFLRPATRVRTEVVGHEPTEGTRKAETDEGRNA